MATEIKCCWEVSLRNPQNVQERAQGGQVYLKVKILDQVKVLDVRHWWLDPRLYEELKWKVHGPKGYQEQRPVLIHIFVDALRVGKNCNTKQHKPYEKARYYIPIQRRFLTHQRVVKDGEIKTRQIERER